MDAGVYVYIAAVYIKDAYPVQRIHDDLDDLTSLDLSFLHL